MDYFTSSVIGATKIATNALLDNVSGVMITTINQVDNEGCDYVTYRTTVPSQKDYGKDGGLVLSKGYESTI